MASVYTSKYYRVTLRGNNGEPMESVYTSKYFEDNVVLLRNEVSRYLERGICIVDHNYNPDSVLNASGLVMTLCREIAKQRNKPWVVVEHLKFRSFSNGVPHKCARVNMPAKMVKALGGNAMVLGQPYGKDGRASHYDYPVIYEKKSGLDVYYNGDKGHDALMAWLHACENDKAMRFALGLPTIVTR